MVLGDRLALVGDHLAGQVADRDPDVPVPEVDPDDQARSREIRTVVPRRPLPITVSTIPAAVRSRTMLDTVAGASCVLRAMSAWVSGSCGRLLLEQPDHPALVGGAQGRGRPGGAGADVGGVVTLCWHG